MLTVDLVRADVQDGWVRPRYLAPDSPRWLGRAADLVDLVSAHVGRTQGEFDEALADLLADGVDFRASRGLAKLLLDRGEFATVAPVPPADVRAAVFLAAGRRHPVAVGIAPDDRAAVLAEVAAAFGTEAEAVEAALFADRPDEQRLTRFEPLEPVELLHRYNTALAQAVLLRATEVRVGLSGATPARYRQLFRFIKFYQLMYRAEAAPGGGYTLTLDGPLSLFRQVSRYGLRLAQFLPALLLCPEFALEADVQWGEPRTAARFSLTAAAGLRSHYRDTGVWASDEQRWFEEQFARRGAPWQLRPAERIVPLAGQRAFVPDYELVHPDGRTALLAILWFWRGRQLGPLLRELAAAAVRNVIVAVSERYQTDDESPDLAGALVIPFKGVLTPAKVRDAAEQVAIHAAGGEDDREP